MKRGWFGPKMIGWGASPASWEGWAVTGVFVLVMGLIGYGLSDTRWVWVAMIAAFLVYLAVVVLTYDKKAQTRL
jgi:membrane-bound ClpP family serine protease